MVEALVSKPHQPYSFPMPAIAGIFNGRPFTF